MVNIAIFTANVTGIKLLEKLDSYNYYPKIITYSNNFQRTSLSRDFSAFTNKFPISFISNNKFTAISKDLSFINADYIVCLDWTKDFFKDAKIEAKILMGQPSLLPMYRGYGSISEQLIKGVATSGLTFSKLSETIDGGNIVHQQQIKIDYNDYPNDIIEKITDTAVNFIMDLKDIGGSFLTDIKQNENKAFYLARQRGKQAIIDFNRDAYSLHNHIRGYGKPFFGAFFIYNNKRVQVWKASTESWQGNYGESGTILKKDEYGIEVAAGEGTITFYEIEIDGERFKGDNIPFEKGNILT